MLLWHDRNRAEGLRRADAERRETILTRAQRMFVKLSATGSVTLEDRDNFRAFKLVVEGGPSRLDQARRALASTAELPDQATAWIYEKALRERAEVSGDATWQGNLGTMIEKARPHGWIDEQKKAIKAHIEWT